MSSDAERVWESLVHAYAGLAPRIAKEVRGKSGMSLAAFDVLRELESSKTGLTMNDLAARIVLSRSQVSRLVDELEGAQLVAREPKPGDKRSSVVTITADGRTSFNETAPAYRAAVAHGVDRAATAEQLRKVAEILDGILPNARDV